MSVLMERRWNPDGEGGLFDEVDEDESTVETDDDDATVRGRARGRA